MSPADTDQPILTLRVFRDRDEFMAEVDLFGIYTTAATVQDAARKAIAAVEQHAISTAIEAYLAKGRTQ